MKVTVYSVNEIQDGSVLRKPNKPAIYAANLGKMTDNYLVTAKKVVLIEVTNDIKIPTKLILSFLKKEFPKAHVMSCGEVSVWNGSYHDPYYLETGKPGDFILLFPYRKIKRLYKGARRAIAQAQEIWQNATCCAVRASLVRKRVWAREGD